MKKLILAAIFAAVSFVSTQAQVRLGGEFSVWYDSKDKSTDYVVRPEIGYKINNLWEVGTTIGFAGNSDESGLSFNMAPFARYTFIRAGIFSMFGEATVGVATRKHCDTAFHIGLRPGVDLELSRHWSLEAHLGFLGYSANNDHIAGAYNPGVGFDFGSATSFALIYQF